MNLFVTVEKRIINPDLEREGGGDTNLGGCFSQEINLVQIFPKNSSLLPINLMLLDKLIVCYFVKIWLWTR